MSGQLSIPEAHPLADLVGVSWVAPEGYGIATVLGIAERLDGYLDVELVRRDGVSTRACLHESTVRQDAALGRFTATPESVTSEPEADRWVTTNGRDFVNGTEHVRLAELGLVSLDPAIARAVEQVPARRLSESPIVVAQTERIVMAVAEKARPKVRAKKSGIAEAVASKAKLRTYLLSHQTVGDAAWLAYRKEHGLPLERETGETREAFIRRVLA